MRSNSPNMARSAGDSAASVSSEMSWATDRLRSTAACPSSVSVRTRRLASAGSGAVRNQVPFGQTIDDAFYCCDIHCGFPAEIDLGTGLKITQFDEGRPLCRGQLLVHPACEYCHVPLVCLSEKKPDLVSKRVRVGCPARVALRLTERLVIPVLHAHIRQ